jgi:hypothetical protein
MPDCTRSTLAARARRALRRVLRSDPQVAPPVYTYLDLSTAHTRPDELETLLAITSGARGPRTIAHDWGAWVNVPCDDDSGAMDTLEQIRERCPDIVRCLRYARGLGCTWINFDADADVVEALAQFDHAQIPTQRSAAVDS